jgi:hypothetical protein
MKELSLYDFCEDSPPHTRKDITLDTVGKGYTIVYPAENPEKRCYVHKLSAVAKYGFEQVCEAEQIHHIDGNKWVNNPENLQPMSLKRHSDVHELGGDTIPQNQHSEQR